MTAFFSIRTLWRTLRFLAICSAVLVPRLATAQCPITVNAGPDQFTCDTAATFTLGGAVTGNFLGLTWSPTAGDSLNPSVRVSQTTDYILTARAVDFSQNLILNGDFEQGNVGFTSGYTYNPGFAVWPPFQTYDVAPVPVGLMPCRDHSTGMTNYMFADGADQPGLRYWCQTVAVQPNTDYLLSTWATSLNPGEPFALLQFTINSDTVGSLTAPAQCTWAEFTGVWNSGTATTATVCIENLVLALPQNDFGIDDIALYPVCSVSDTVTLHVTPVHATAQVADTLDCLTKTLTLVAQATGGGPSETYLWTSSPSGIISAGADTPTPTVSAAGTYTVTISNADNGCTDTASVTVVSNTQPPGATLLPPSTLTCLRLFDTLRVANIDPNFTYAWSTANGQFVSGENTATPIVSAPGSYTVTVTNPSNGCTSTSILTVLQNTAVPVLTIQTPVPVTCLTTDQTLTAQAVGGGNFSIVWEASNGGKITNGVSTLTPTISQSGVYTLKTTGPINGCTATASVTVIADTLPPSINLAPPAILNCTTAVVTLSANVQPASSAYAWSGNGIVSGVSTATPTVNLAETYALTVTHPTNGCTVTASVSVGLDTLRPNISIAPPTMLNCTTAVIALSANAQPTGSAYAWSGSGIVSGAATAMPSVNSPGPYLVTATHPTNGCTATAATTVLEDKAAPVFSINPAPLLTCTAPIAQLSATVSQPTGGQFTAQWTTASGNILSGANTLQPSVNALGVYVLTIQNPKNGCTATATATVSENKTAPVCAVISFPILTCSPPQVTLVATADAGGAAMIFQWLGPLVVSGGNTLTPSVGASGTYTLVATNQTNGCSATASATVFSDTLRPNVSIATPGILTCLTLSLPLNATASSSGTDFALTWTTTGGNFVSGENTLTPNVNQSGQYNLLISNLKNGCTNTASVVVGQNTAPPQTEAGPSEVLHCQQQQVMLTGTATPATVQYSWAGAGIVSGQNTASPTVTQAGTYTLTVTRTDNGCTDTDETTVTAIPPPSFEADWQDPTCNTATGRVEFVALTGGQPPLEFSLDGGATFQNSPVFGGLKNGTYALVLRDQYGCTTTQSVDLESGEPPIVQLPASISLMLGESAVLQPTTVPPAAAIAAWTWSPAEFLSCADCPAPTASPLYSRRYTLTVTDAGGCTGSATVEILVNRRPDVYAPNAISPNGDGVNEGFTLFGGPGAALIREVEIFDRWGSLVWRGENLSLNDEALGWDGRVRGQAASPGVFVWTAVVEFVDGRLEMFSGDVTVVR